MNVEGLELCRPPTAFLRRPERLVLGCVSRGQVTVCLCGWRVPTALTARSGEPFLLRSEDPRLRDLY